MVHLILIKKSQGGEGDTSPTREKMNYECRKRTKYPLPLTCDHAGVFFREKRERGGGVTKDVRGPDCKLHSGVR